MPRPHKPSRSQKAADAISLSGFYRHFDVEECLCFFSAALASAGLDENDLPDHQRTLFRDLHNPLDEETLGEMLSYWDYDLARLFDRGRRHSPKNTPAKPRIDVWVEITSKGNLKAEWFPRGAKGLSELPAASDFAWFMRHTNRGQGIHTRPSNELFFLRGVQSAIFDVSSQGPGLTSPLSHVLLGACERVVARLKERLSRHFDVTMLTDVFVEWVDLQDGSGWSIPAEYRVVKWEIADPQLVQLQAELAELAGMDHLLGFSEQALLRAELAIEEQGRRAAVPPAPHKSAERIAKKLKQEGCAATPKKVERALYLLNRHRPGRALDKPSGNVVSFRAPSDQG